MTSTALHQIIASNNRAVRRKRRWRQARETMVAIGLIAAAFTLATQLLVLIGGLG